MPVFRVTMPAQPFSFPHLTRPVNPPATHPVGYYPVKYFLDSFSRLLLSFLAVPDPGFDPATLCRISAMCRIRSILNYLRPAPRIPRADIPGSQSQGNNQQWHFAGRSTQQLFQFGRLAIYFVSSLHRPAIRPRVSAIIGICPADTTSTSRTHHHTIDRHLLGHSSSRVRDCTAWNETISSFSSFRINTFVHFGN